MNSEETALLSTLARVILEIRILGYQGQHTGLSKEKSALIADLADAVHNIPEAILSKDFDFNFHSDIMLGGFDAKYKDIHSLKPLAIYKNYLGQIIGK